MSLSLPASTRHAAAKSTLNFDWLVPFKPSFSQSEVAGITGLSERMIQKLFDQGKQISGHQYNAGNGMRYTLRIPRVFVITLLVQSARYEAEDKCEAVISCFREFSGPELLLIADAARQLAAKKGSL